jgi:hypothetical protein
MKKFECYSFVNDNNNNLIFLPLSERERVEGELELQLCPHSTCARHDSPDCEKMKHSFVSLNILPIIDITLYQYLKIYDDFKKEMLNGRKIQIELKLFTVQCKKALAFRVKKLNI